MNIFTGNIHFTMGSVKCGRSKGKIQSLTFQDSSSGGLTKSNIFKHDLLKLDFFIVFTIKVPEHVIVGLPQWYQITLKFIEIGLKIILCVEVRRKAFGLLK